VPEGEHGTPNRCLRNPQHNFSAGVTCFVEFLRLAGLGKRQNGFYVGFEFPESTSFAISIRQEGIRSRSRAQ
jgi:hypothetical protein